jgi:glycosyltransferase involved in cell wall biosynthesis
VSIYLRRDTSAWFLLVGEGPIQEELERLFQEHGVAQRVVMAGKKTGRELQDAYQAMDVFVFASKSETQGMVLTEAMAAGNPVIALEASGTREVVADRKNGRLLKEDASEENFAEAILEVARDAETHKSWQQNSLQTAQAFSRTTSARKLEALYHKAIQDTASGSSNVHLDFGPLNGLIERIKFEWDLLSEKTDAAVNALQSGRGK